jgi:hypothetical protein
MRADIKDSDAPDVIKTKVDAMNNKIGILNGTLERAMDAYARAWNTAPNTPAAKAYKDIKMKTIEAHKNNILQTVLNYGTLEFEGKGKMTRIPHPGSLAMQIEQAMGMI